MQQESNWRYYLIGIVVVACLALIWPTARYVYFTTTTPEPKAEQFDDKASYDEAFQQYEDQRISLQRNAISLGLDLIGGADVLLEINENDMRRELLEDRRDALIHNLQASSISARVSVAENGQTLNIDLDDPADARQVLSVVTGDAFEGVLAEPTPEQEGLLRAGEPVQIGLDSDYLQSQMRQAMDSALTVINERLNVFGLTQPSVSRQSDANAIRVQVPGERDPQRVISDLIQPARLAFFMVYGTMSEAGNVEHQNMVQERLERIETTNDEDETEVNWRIKPGEVLPAGYQLMQGRVPITDERTGQITGFEVRPYIVRDRYEMLGVNLSDATVRPNMNSLSGGVSISLLFNRQGAREFAEATRRAMEGGQKRQLAIAIDETIHSAPTVQNVITGGAAEITGSFSIDEARRLADLLEAGALRTSLTPKGMRTVGPTLGAESIAASVRALMIGAAAVSLFMIFYYGTAGVISIIALALNLLVIIACLDMFNATLTLSGIGGIILTLGMAVDANVLIYERIREELDGGRDLRAAIRAGFGQAFSVIFDSNLTTLLAAFVLLQFGEGTVRGFALTMAFGLVANLFTGLTVTYALCRAWFNLRGKLSLGALRMFRNTNIDFIGLRRLSFPLSGLMFLGVVAVLLFKGPEFAVDFRGGVLADVQIQNAEEDQTVALREALSQGGISGEQARVQRIVGGGGEEYLVRVVLQETDPQTGEELTGGNAVSTTREILEGALAEAYGDQIEIRSVTGVSKEVGQGFQQIAIMVVIGASICILLYLWFRFELVFGVAAVIALVHDLAIVLGVITLLNVQISLDIVSALMILLGFSVNDTIVIFDRIRENSHQMFGRPFKEICNRAMNRSLSRTIITSATTIGIMIVMYFFGGHSLQPFALTLIVGGLIGTYSSDFLAAPFVYWWDKRQQGALVDHLGRKTVGVAETGAPPAAAPATAGSAGGASGAGEPRRRGRR